MTDKVKTELGKLLIDLGKLIFGGVVLATVLKIENVSKLIVVGIGFSIVLLLCVTGLLFISKTQ